MKNRNKTNITLPRRKSSIIFLMFLPYILLSFVQNPCRGNNFIAAQNLSSNIILKETFIVKNSFPSHLDYSDQKIESLMSQAKIKYQQNQIYEVFEITEQAESIAKNLKNVAWQIKIKRFYSGVYRDLNFFKESLEELEEIDQMLKKLSNDYQRNKFLLINNQDKALLYLCKKDYEKSLSYLIEGEKVYENLLAVSDEKYLMAKSEELKGRIYFYKNEFENSFLAYQSALDLLKNHKNTKDPVYGYIYAGLGSLVCCGQMDSLNAATYFSKADAFLTIPENPEMKLFVSQKLKEYHAGKKEDSKHLHYTQIRDSVRYQMNFARKKMIADFHHKVKFKSEKNESRIKIFYTIVFSILMVLLGLWFYYLNKRKQKSDEVLLNPHHKIEEDEAHDLIPVGIGIAEETEALILNKLEDFEKEKLYLDGKINLATVAVFCDSNSKYVSEVIKKNKDTDFQGYINRLRIEYIEHKLLTDDQYLLYKISYLAEEAGFSSYSKFSALFKEIKGITPSVFIKKLRGEKNS